MPRDLVSGNGRPCQDELTRFSSVVDGPSYMIPDGGFYLPLVDQTRDGALKDQRGIHPYSIPCVAIHVEQHLTCCNLSRGRSFSASFGTFDHDSS